jgi:tetratricopeptide (TPR) repeat protein
MDCTAFGLNAGGHHFVSLLYHVANTLLLFLFLRSATGAPWRSGFVAALFAWHPMHVESVAWASERKDVLCTFFWMLTLLAYLQYVRALGRPLGVRRAAVYYVAAVILCACSLMSKPMAVTLPFVLLLLDLWPLNRIAPFQCSAAPDITAVCQPVSLGRLLLEKIPFFVLIIGGSLSTYLVQSQAGAVAKISVAERLANAVLAYARYTSKLFWPTDLAIVYPHPRHWPMWLALAAVALLLVWTFVCAYNWRKSPYLAVGWFWFLGVLVPTIGLIQVGAQSMADRYTYIPSIGLFIVVAWGAAEFLSRRDSGRVVLAICGGAILLGCVGATSLQIGLWRDSITLFRHAMEVTTDNYVAANTLGKAYEETGDNVHALLLYRAAVESEPRFPYSQFNLAMILLELGQPQEALQHLQVAADLEPRDADIQYDLGIYFSQHNAWTNALNCFSNSILVRPKFPPAQLAIGAALANLDRPAQAAAHLREALQLNPKLLSAKTNLDRLLAAHPELR